MRDDKPSLTLLAGVPLRHRIVNKTLPEEPNGWTWLTWVYSGCRWKRKTRGWLESRVCTVLCADSWCSWIVLLRD